MEKVRFSSLCWINDTRWPPVCKALQEKKLSNISVLKTCIAFMFEFAVASIKVLRLMLLQFFEICPEI